MFSTLKEWILFQKMFPDFILKVNSYIKNYHYSNMVIHKKSKNSLAFILTLFFV